MISPVDNPGHRSFITLPDFYHIKSLWPSGRLLRKTYISFFQGKKQDSAKAVHAFKAKNDKKDLSEEVQRISEITQQVSETTDLEHFCALMREHETIVSSHIGIEPIQHSYPGFEGQLKSLGAWGGDFLLAATPWPESAVREYFSSKSLDTLFCFDELTLKP